MEPISLIVFLKSIGFNFQEILKMIVLVGMNFVFICFILFWIRKPLIKFFTTMYEAMRAIPRMDKSIEELNKTLQEHIIQTDLRMTEGDERFRKLEEIIKEIKAHVGLK